jgi:signal transduction histidine kinase
LSALAFDAVVLTSQETVKNSPDIRGAVNSFRESVISISQDLRRISLDLRPDLIDDLGLIPSLRWLLDRFRQGSDIAAQLNVEGENRNPIPKKISDNLFRIVQEALNNVKRHSLARSVLVNVQLTDSKIQISVQDDGRGFNFQRSYAKLASEGKLGLIGMQQRVQFINGSFSCQSEADKGTTITVEVELG